MKVTEIRESNRYKTLLNMVKDRAGNNVVIPPGTFRQWDFAIANGMPLRGTVYGTLHQAVRAGKVQVTYRYEGNRKLAFYSAMPHSKSDLVTV